MAKTLLIALALSALMVSVLPAADAPSNVEVRADVKMPMGDGTMLSANIFLPEGKGPFPVILQRSPYGKGDEKLSDGRFFAAQGYVFVSQDCRGKGDSQGVWEPFIHEMADGQDTQHWVAEQPWCDGRVGTFGGSYVGFTQWIAAPNAGDQFRAAYSVVPLIDPYGDALYTNGALNLALAMGWGSAVSYGCGEAMPIVRWNAEQWLTAYRTLPLSTWDSALGRKVQFLRDWVAHPQFDEYWAGQSVRNRWQDITVPNLVVGGWFDIFAKSVFDHVNAVRTLSRSPAARSRQHLIVGPWSHGVSDSTKTGDLDFGPISPVKSIRLDDLRRQWFDHWLKGEETDAVEKWPAFRIFVMGRNQWRDEPEWPLKRTQYTPWYFHSRGSANTLSGDGQLSDLKPDHEPADAFVYDPENPVPTAGGCNLVNCPVGPRDQTAVEKRTDVLVFTSEELKTDLEVTGPVKVVLYAASTAVDTDWTAKLVDVYPEGRQQAAISLCDGIVRARWRDSTEKPAFLRPGEVCRYEIDLWVTSNVFLAGHKIRVEISSSNFPRFDRNLNTDDPWGMAAKPVIATQTIHHDRERASHILLPVIP